MFSIYLVTNKENGKVYVGQTCQDLDVYLRNDVTRAMLNNGDRKPHLYNAIRKWGEEAFSIRLLCSVCTKPVADVAERFFIKKYNSQDKTIGYNIAAGGGGSYGYTRVISPEHREKCRLAGLGRKQSEETKRKREETRIANQKGLLPKDVSEKLAKAYRLKKLAKLAKLENKGI